MKLSVFKTMVESDRVMLMLLLSLSWLYSASTLVGATVPEGSSVRKHNQHSCINHILKAL
jgi:hypothetical protein